MLMRDNVERIMLFVGFLVLVFALFQYSYGQEYAPDVTTTYGPVRGIVEEYKGRKVLKYMGIRYAKPPLNELRFMRPTPPDPWSDIILATDYGKSCLQRFPGGVILPNETSEDCLFINVFVNEETLLDRERQLKPVLFWIHGGGFQAGSDHERYAFNPIPIVPLHDVVLVTINYRLNAFGFLYPGLLVSEIPGNMGIWDQNFALRWTRENIAKFGGDPEKVTIFGESAGSMSVGLHLISPLSKNLFNNAIMESGAPWPVAKGSKEQVKKASKNIILFVGCGDRNDTLACLQQVDAQVFLKIAPSLFPLYMKPIFGDELLPKTPEQFFSQKSLDNDKNLLIGAEEKDGSLFLGIFNSTIFLPNVSLTYDDGLEILRAITQNQSVDFFAAHYFGPSRTIPSQDVLKGLMFASSDLMFVCPSYAYGLGMANVSRTGAKSYAYIHTQRPQTSMIEICNLNPTMGPCHTDEIPYVFGEPFRSPEKFSKSDIVLSMNMMEIWTQFARSGKSPKQGPVEWPSLGPGKEPHVVDLNEKFIGKLDSSRINFCLQNWEIFHSAFSIL